MPYPYKSVTNALLNKMRSKGENVTPLKLQKLLYYTCGYYLAASGGRPLIDHTFEAWEYGPVLPVLYRHFRHYGNRPITSLAYDYDPMSGARVPTPPPEGDALFDQVADFVVATYGDYSGLRLSAMTHAPGSPWEQTRQDNPGIKDANIDRSKLLEYFAKFVEPQGDREVA